MQTRLVALAVVVGFAAIQCGPSARPNPKRVDPLEGDSEGANGHSPSRLEERPSDGTKGKPSDWSVVQPLESSTTGSGTSRRTARVVVTSDAQKHGSAMHFRFLVNSEPISGVFVAPGGRTSTFTIPVGTVHFTVDECEWEAQGFELGPDEEMPLSCKLIKDGDCCEVAIPVDDASKSTKPDKSG